MEQAQAQTASGEPDKLDQSGLCLLSLDGGGVRGLSTLYILKGIMDKLNHDRTAAGHRTVEPCEIFDVIGGTSTGGYAYNELQSYDLSNLTDSSLSC